ITARQYLPDDRRVHRGRPEGVAREGGSEQQRRVSNLPRPLHRRLRRAPAASADTLHNVLEDWVVRCRGLLSTLQVIRDAIWWLYAVAFKHMPGVVEGRRVRGCEAAGDGRGFVAN